MSENHFDYMFVEPKYLRADPSYQRKIDYTRVNRIVKNFDGNLFNEPKVSKRDDGFYYIFDGDHSVAAHMIKFGKDAPIKCKVFYGLTPEQEMQLFIQQNGISKTPTRIEKLRAMNNYNDPEVTEMVESARVAGIEIEFTQGPAVNRIIAVDTVFSIFKAIGRTNFINMLCVIKGIWLGDSDSLTGNILKGFAYLYRFCPDQMKTIPNREIINSLGGWPVRKLAERANTLQGRADRRYAFAIAERYNKGKRKNRIILPEK